MRSVPRRFMEERGDIDVLLGSVSPGPQGALRLDDAERVGAAARARSKRWACSTRSPARTATSSRRSPGTRRLPSGLTLVTHSAEPSSRTADALSLLGSWVATTDAEPERAKDLASAGRALIRRPLDEPSRGRIQAHAELSPPATRAPDAPRARPNDAKPRRTTQRLCGSIPIYLTGVSSRLVAGPSPRRWSG
jgi:hypothetical protein